MAKSRRLRGRPTGILTMPFTMRQVLDRTIAIMGDDAEAPPNPCLTTQKDIWFPDPVKIAKCIISKPTIREMGEDEEKIYCGMIYGPEYSDYEYKAKKRIAKTIRKLFRKHLPMMNDLLEKRKKENKENIRKDFKAWLQKGKESILKEKEADEMGSITSKSLEKLNETQRSEESSPVLSREISEFTLDMTVDPPDKDLIAKLNLFQVKKLIEETTCEVLTKPLQIAAFMKDKSVELKSFSEKSSQESSYILNRLSDAYSLLEKILFKTESKELATAVVEEVPYSIETDQETKERVNSIIKAYRNHPYLIRALTKV